MAGKASSNQDILTIATKQRHLTLLRKVQNNNALTKTELRELARFEKKRTTRKKTQKREYPLTDKQKCFCQEYIIDLNAKQAAIRAGYSKHSAEITGSKLLRNPKVSDEVAKLKSQRGERLEITADSVVKEIAKIGFQNIANYLQMAGDDEGYISMEVLNNLTPEQTACIAEITEYETDTGRKRFKFKLHDKLKALELLGRHLGIFNDNLNLKLPEGCGVLVAPQAIDKDEWSKMASQKKVNGK